MILYDYMIRYDAKQILKQYSSTINSIPHGDFSRPDETKKLRVDGPKKCVPGFGFLVVWFKIIGWAGLGRVRLGCSVGLI